MKLSTAKQKLKVAREKARWIREEISILRQIIIKAGEDPDWREDHTERNRQIYIKWKSGFRFTEIGKEFKLSATRISSICQRIEISLEKKSFLYDKYKDLEIYRKQKKPNSKRN